MNAAGGSNCCTRRGGARSPHAKSRRPQELLSAAEAHHLAPEAKIGEFGAVLCRASAQVNVARLLEALEAACVRSGVRVHAHEPVHKLYYESGRVHGVQTQRRMLPADVVVVACGAWTSGLDPVLAAAAPITPVKGQAIALRGGLDTPLILRSQPYYLLSQRDGTLLAGATSEPHAGFDARPTGDATDAIAMGIGAFVPSLRRRAIVRHWAGLRPKGADSRPFIGPIGEVAGLVVAAGHYKLGIGLAPITGRIICDQVFGRAVEHDLSTCVPGRLGE